MGESKNKTDKATRRQVYSAIGAASYDANITIIISRLMDENVPR